MKWRQSLSDNKWFIALGALAILWANLPYLVGYRVADQPHAFGGFFIFEQDGFSYLAKMRQGANGNWLFHLPYTTESHNGVFLYVFYLLAGKVTGALGLPFITGYHLFRLAGSTAVLAAGIGFVRHFVPAGRAALLAWGMALFGGGVGWLISLFNPTYVAFASVAPDAFLYSVFFGPPHIIWALALLIWLLPAGFALLRAGRGAGRAFLLGLGGLGMTLCRPEYGLILLGVLAAYLGSLGLARRRFPGRELGLAATAAIPITPYLIYVYWIFQANPAMAGWGAQNPFDTPPVLNVLAGIGPFLLPAALGVLAGRWWRDEVRLPLVAWWAALPVMLYVPLSLSRRLIGGAQLAMAVPAGFWLDRHLFPWLAQARRRRLAAAPVLAVLSLLLISYPLLFGLGAAAYVREHPPSLFFWDSTLAALDWLAAQPGHPVVLAAEQTGNWIPAFSSAVPVLGHPIETLEADQKRANVARFYTAGQPDILATYGVDLIWWGPAERELGNWDPANLPGAQLAFQQGEVQVWQLQHRSSDQEGKP